jgi:hypothetical protein
MVPRRKHGNFVVGHKLFEYAVVVVGSMAKRETQWLQHALLGALCKRCGNGSNPVIQRLLAKKNGKVVDSVNGACNRDKRRRCRRCCCCGEGCCERRCQSDRMACAATAPTARVRWPYTVDCVRSDGAPCRVPVRTRCPRRGAPDQNKEHGTDGVNSTRREALCVSVDASLLSYASDFSPRGHYE